MWTFDETACNRLKQFLSVISPTMNETDMASLLRTHWGTLGVITDTDFMGNVHARKNGSKDINIALCAHMDTVAIQITKILPNGMLQFRRIGITPHVLLGQKVLIKTSNGIVNGVIGFDPTSQYGQPKGLVDEDLWIDICALSRQEAELMVSIGDLAVLDNEFTILNNDFLCGTALDNRLGLFILTECVRWFSDKKHL